MEEPIIRLTDGSVSAAVSLFGRRAKSLRLGIEFQPYRLGAKNEFIQGNLQSHHFYEWNATQFRLLLEFEALWLKDHGHVEKGSTQCGGGTSCPESANH